MNKTKSTIIITGVLLSALAALFLSLKGGNNKHLSESKTIRSAEFSPKTLKELMALNTNEIEKCSIAFMSILCAEGLPGSEGISVDESEQMIAKMAQRIKSETTRNLHQFRQSPQNFEHSEAYFRMLVLATVLHEDFGVHYNPAKITQAGVFEPNESFFADSKDVFLHGLLSGKHMGTCSSMPVLYVAVGRELGYPLKLVTAKNHLFIRWEDAMERRNFETTGEGLNSFDDKYYRSWPLPFSENEEKQYGYLKSLTKSEELGVFLSIRANCLEAAGQHKEAKETFVHANRYQRLQPES